MPIHFGVTVREGKYGLKLTREEYAIVNNKNSLLEPRFTTFAEKDGKYYGTRHFGELLSSPLSPTYADKEGKTYSDEWCAKQLKECLENYDLNMEFYSALNRDEFNNAINSFLRENKGFKSVSDLNEFDAVPGYYMMVLDEYCQVYIGTSGDIKHRITTHWSKRKQFDRLLFPMGAVNTSILSVDSFRAYDTTRIYVFPTAKIYDSEDDYINCFPPEFAANRLAGGKMDGGLRQAIAILNLKKRELGTLKK